MKINPNEPAFNSGYKFEQSENGLQYERAPIGMTIRAEIASRIMAGAVGGITVTVLPTREDVQAMAKFSVCAADALIAELSR